MRVSLATIMASFLAFAPTITADDSKSGQDKGKQIIGLYKIASGENDGEEIAGERLGDITVRITAETIAAYNKDQDEIYLARYELDTGQDPYQIKMSQTGGPEETRGGNARGLIKAEGDTLKVIYAARGGQLPTEFKTQEGYGQILLVLERVEEEP